MGSEISVARLLRRAQWTALTGDQVVGTATGLMRPDGRWFVSIDTWDDEAFVVLLEAVRADLRQDVYANVDEASATELRRWSSAGFAVGRREHEYTIDVAVAVAALAGSALPADLVLVGADEVDEHELRRLDDALRQDIPGSDGWFNDPDEFHDYTFDERHFDPSTYLVAVDDTAHAFAGLVRVWMDPGQPRLGMVGVRSDYRRQGLARAMLQTVFVRLQGRDIASVAAEVDVNNTASNQLLVGAGARRVGGTVELVNRGPAVVDPRTPPVETDAPPAS